MKKNLTSLTKYAGCSGKVMETGDYFKSRGKTCEADRAGF
jgi:hypothetical protein